MNILDEITKGRQSKSKSNLNSSTSVLASEFQVPPGNPIIIVPTVGMPGNLSLANVKQFLQGGTY